MDYGLVGPYLSMMPQTLLERELKALADPERAKNLQRFFKTGKGQYGEGDVFLGITVPMIRATAVRHQELPLPGIRGALKSRYHEVRYAALEILVMQYECGDPEKRQEVFDFYLSSTDGINNWDLVDTSAPYIVGGHLLDKTREILDTLAGSPNIWERRIAIVATQGLIRKGETEDTFRIAQILLPDKHDLIHKAVGWMLREAGKVFRPALTHFLQEHYGNIPRTALRYAIEHFQPEQRKLILSGKFEF